MRAGHEVTGPNGDKVETPSPKTLRRAAPQLGEAVQRALLAQPLCQP